MTSVIMGIHNSTQSRVEPLTFRFPPSPQPLPLAAYIWQPFNKRKYAVSLSKNDDSFAADIGTGTIATIPSNSELASFPERSKPIYFLHTRDGDSTVLAGTVVYSLDSLCPQFDGSPNSNLFCDRFGIEFHADNHTHVRAISPFEFTSCFGLWD